MNTIHPALNRLRKQTVRLLSGAPMPVAAALQLRREALHRALYLQRIFYAAAFFFVAKEDVLNKFLQSATVKPLWCVAWVPWVGVPAAGGAIFASTLVSAAACALWPSKRWLRIVFALSILQQGALSNSFGKINHTYHAFVVCAALLCLSPLGTLDSIRRSTTRAQTLLLATWSLYASLMLAYTISGLWKVGFGLSQLLRGEVNAFSPMALAYHVAGRLVRTADTTIVASWVLEHPMLGWPLNLFVIYIETFAIVAAFRPRLHRAFAISLAAFHFGVALVLNIGFHQHILLLGLLGVCSPFAPETTTLKALMLDLPVFGDIIRWLQTRHSRAQRDARSA